MSSWHFDQLKYAIGFGGIMSFYGIASLIVWVLGSKMGYQTSETVVIIALVLLTMPFALVIGFVASRRKKKRLKAEAEAEEQAAAERASAEAESPGTQKLSTPVGDFTDINGGAQEVVQFLKSSNLGVGGKDAVYSLPWYLIAGGPKTGKSSLIIGSNLNVQTLPSQRQSEQKFVRPTTSVDWRVTDNAVFIDTAGRYQKEGVDGDEWSALLDTIKKNRSNRSLDGFLLVVNLENVLNSNEREVEDSAKLLRTRLDEATQRLKLRFPVYLVFTNADAIEGFRDSFSASKDEGRNLVWGSTIPLEKSDNAQAMFDTEFEILHNSLMKRRLMRLSAPFPPVRQLRIFNFPLHFGAARRKIGAFVATLFRPNPFSENPFLRGFYFTATPSSANRNPKSPQGTGNSYFTERFLHDVVLRDKDLVRTFLAQRQRPPILGWLLTMMGVLATISLIVISGVSLLSNRQLLGDAKDRGATVVKIQQNDAGKNPLEKGPDETVREMNALDDLRQLMVRLDEYERNGAPYYMRFGMYSGDNIFKRRLLPIYMGSIEQRFKVPTIRQVESELRKFASSQPVANPAALTDQEEQNLEKKYDLLKAYLMLTNEYNERAEASSIATAFKEYWVAESKLPVSLHLTAEQHLDFWSKQVKRDDDDYRFPRIVGDQKLIADARQKLQAFPAIQRYYKRKITEVSKEVEAANGPINVVNILTNNAAETGILEGSYTVPGAYTKAGNELMKTKINEASEKLSEDDWVMGEPGKKSTSAATDTAKIQERYERDYADHWRKLVQNVDVVQYKNKTDAENALDALRSQGSPMKILLQEIAKNTNLSARDQGAGWWEWIKSWFVTSQKTETGGNTQVEKEFRPLFAFMGKKDDPASGQIEKYGGQLNEVFKKMEGLDEDEFQEAGKQVEGKSDPIRLADREGNISDLVKGFNETPSGQELASLLEEPLGRLRELLGADAKSQLAKQWTLQILPAAREIEKGYPFDESTADADLTKLTAFLNPADGKLSKYYKGISKYFEDQNGRLKLKENSEIKFSDEFILYLNNAFLLQKALYGTSPTPKFDYEFRIMPVKAALVEVTLDGQRVTSEGTASIKQTFPAGTSTETGVFVNFVSSSTSATPPPIPSNSANSANSNVDTAGTPAKVRNEPAGGQLRFAGTWGLFKFVDAGQPQKQAGGQYRLTHTLGGKSISSEITPSGGDLFDKAIFRTLRAPESLLKKPT
ncbi:MAG: type VI secretion system membrane subunit TssM [Pyrinomonadaceae bacterium]